MYGGGPRFGVLVRLPADVYDQALPPLPITDRIRARICSLTASRSRLSRR